MRVLTTDNDRIRRELGFELVDAERRAGLRPQQPAPKPAPPAPKEQAQ